MPVNSSPAKSKPTTRSSLRQSLNLASVGKAFADVINKDKDATKNTKKTKETSRRSSALSSLPPGPRASMGDVRPPSQVSKRTGTPDSKTVTRRRVSATYTRSSSDEQSSKLSETPNGSQARTSTLRPKNLNATSALPKYRPKSVILEHAKPPSPVRAGTRRRLSTTSEDEKKEQTPIAPLSPAEKNSRPISPLPQRAALKANLTNSITATPPATPSKPKIFTPSSVRTSPYRPTKIVKTAPPTSAIPRPPSSSTSSLALPHTPKKSTPKASTPKTSGLKTNLGLSRSSQDKNTATITPSHGSSSPFSRDSPSPLARRSRNGSNFTTPASSMVSGNMSHISEGTSEDSDAEDVEILLAPVAAIGAPTPAMPRIQTSRKRVIPQTPTRYGLPGRADMSYASPDSANKSSSSLRPPQRQTPNSQLARGSILSWEQLANEASVNMGEDEFGRMLSEIPAPFRSGAASPSLSSQMDVPESPCLSAIDSPGGFGSISQVLLPDVTPSPAMHNSSIQSRFDLPSDAAVVADSSTSTMLRLQLAAAENTARERLFQIQAMEEEIHDLKQAHGHQMEESQKQMVYMEAQWREKDEQALYSASLEDKLRHLEISHERAIEETVKRCQEDALKSQSLVFKTEGLRCEAMFSARLAASSWSAVRDTCEVELDLIRDDKAVFSLLLMQLDQMYSSAL